MWYKPRLYTLDNTTCFLCRPPPPLLISEAVKKCPISWKTFLVGAHWEVAMLKSLILPQIWNVCHLRKCTCTSFPKLLCGKDLEIQFSAISMHFLMCSSSFKTISKVAFDLGRQKTPLIRGANPLLFFSVMFVMTTFGSRKEFPSSRKSKVVLTNVTENSCRKTKMSFTIYAHK